MKTFKEYIFFSLNEALAQRITVKRGGGSYEKYRSKGLSKATDEDAVELVQRVKSRLKLTDINKPERGFMGYASAPPRTLTAENISDAVAGLGATNIKYTSGVDGVVKFASVYFELDGIVYSLRAREFENGNNNTLDFGSYSVYS